MRKKIFASVVAVFLTVSFVAPTAFFVVPRQAVAQVPVAVVADPGWIEQTISAVNNAIQGVTGPINTAANIADKINTYVLQPLAFVLSGNLMKALTSSVIGFVIGKANGTGVPQFVVDVKRSLQTVGDSQALAYLRQVGMTNSPFAGSISSALRTDYLSKTSLAGFWAANMNTLARSSPDVPAYLAGNWSQGGVAAWFALTTQTQNDPYSLYNHTKTQLEAVVGSGAGGATDVRLADINRGGGFMSWCGTNDSVAASAGNNPDKIPSSVAPTPDPAGKFFDGFGTAYSTQADANAADASHSATSRSANLEAGMTATGGIGINPGDPCSNNGIAGTIKTPGSVIKSTLDKVLGGQQDQIVRMGNVGGQISDILGKIGKIINTVQFASSLLGGDSGGILAVNSTSASNPNSRLTQFAPTYDSSGNFTSDYAGVTNTKIYKDAATDGSSGSDKSNLVSKYEIAWNSISTSADTASTALNSLASFCTAAADKAARAMTVDEFGAQITPTTDLSTIHSIFIDAARAQAAAATSTITAAVAPVLAQAVNATTVITKVRAMIQKVQSELNAPTAATASVFTADLQELQDMPPSATDFALAQQNALEFGAEANPAGSLTVSGSSLVGKMNLLSTNAEALKISVCTPGGAAVTGG